MVKKKKKKADKGKGERNATGLYFQRKFVALKLKKLSILPYLSSIFSFSFLNPTISHDRCMMDASLYPPTIGL